MEATGFLNFISLNTEDQEPEVERIVDEQNIELSNPDINNETASSKVNDDPIPEITIDLPETKNNTIEKSIPLAEKNMRTSTLYFVNISKTLLPNH